MGIWARQEDSTHSHESRIYVNVLLAVVPPPSGGKDEHRQYAEYQTDVCGEGLQPAKYCCERKTFVARGPVVVLAVTLAKLVGVPKSSEPGRQYKSMTFFITRSEREFRACWPLFLGVS
jgi:hypothetical protein